MCLGVIIRKSNGCKYSMNIPPTSGNTYGDMDFQNNKIDIAATVFLEGSKISPTIFSQDAGQQTRIIDLSESHALLRFYSEFLDDDGNYIMSYEEARPYLNLDGSKTQIIDGDNHDYDDFGFALYQLYEEPQILELVRDYKRLNTASVEEQIAQVVEKPSLLRAIYRPDEAVIQAAFDAIGAIHGKTLTSDEQDYLRSVLVDAPSQAIDLNNPHAQLLLMPEQTSNPTFVHVDLQDEFTLVWFEEEQEAIDAQMMSIRQLVDNNRDVPQFFVRYDYDPISDKVTGGEAGGFSRDPNVENNDDDLIFLYQKSTNGAFESTEIAAALTDQGTDIVFFTGVNESICFNFSITGAINAGLQTVTSGEVTFNSWNPRDESQLSKHPYAYYTWTVANAGQLQELIDNNQRFIP